MIPVSLLNASSLYAVRLSNSTMNDEWTGYAIRGATALVVFVVLWIAARLHFHERLRDDEPFDAGLD